MYILWEAPSPRSYKQPLHTYFCLQGLLEPDLRDPTVLSGSQANTTNTPSSSRSSVSSRGGKAQELPAAMSAFNLVILGLLTSVPPASCQQGLGNLQPWMQGLIAVAVYLVLVAIAFAVNHFWCQEEPEPGNVVMTVGNKADGILVGMDGRYSSTVASFRSSEHKNAYENALEEEESKVRSTAM
nr:PDZK1-interacting protein 1 isoform X1 [Marmota flaviventris]